MIAQANGHRLLDQYGTPMKRRRQVRYLGEQADKSRSVRARYDAAQTTDEYKNIWAATDGYDADSANSPAVREKLVQRSRYEIANNGYADGIASTAATDLVGIGPKLRMQTGSEPFNQLIEAVWYDWTKAVQFRRKLWCMAHAKHSDGEAIAVIRRNNRIKHRIKLDVCLYETEQCQTPLLPFSDENYVDGIRFDEFGNPLWYDILRQHPGATGYMRLDLTPERIPAEFVMHWFKMRRPGQHRGIPESTSTLNTGAAARRWREATLAAAETAADFSLLIKTEMMPDDAEPVASMDTLDIQKRMMTALPPGYDAFQMRAEHPSSTYAEFHKSLINEQARPKSMPYNKAACDSSSYNYASGRLDHQTYYAALDVEREDCNDLVLDVLFDAWFDRAIITYGWLTGDPMTVNPAARSHMWDWPKHRVADVKVEADSIDTRLKNGTTTLPSVYSDAGEDYEDEVIKQATANGVTVEQQKQINLLSNVPVQAMPYVAQLLGLQSREQTREVANVP